MADVGEPFDTLASVEDMLTSLPDFSDPLPGLEGQHALQPAESAEDDARCSDWFLQMIGNDALHGSAFGACLNDSAPQTWGTIPSAAAETAAAHSRAAMPVPGLPHRSARDLLQGGAFNNHGSKTQMMYSNPFHMVAQQQLYEQEWKQQQGHSGLAVYGGSQSMPLLAALPVGLQLQQSLHTSSNLSTELHTNAPSPRSEQLISKHSSHGPCCEGSPCGPASFSSLPQGPNSSSSLHASRNVLANSLLEPRGSAKIKLATGARGRRTRAAAAACAKGRSDSCGGGGSGNVPFKSKSSGNLATKHSSPAANGGVAAAAGLPIKDTTQRRNAQIRQLEAELAKKASLVAKLEEDRRELLTRERLLQLQVNSSDRAIKVFREDGIGPHLQSILASFRSNVNRALVAMLISQLPHGAAFGELCLADFALIWKTWVDEMSTVLSLRRADGDTPELQQRVVELSERTQDFAMACSVQQPALMLQVATHSMLTLEQLPGSCHGGGGPAARGAVMQQLGLSDAQCSDLCKVHGLYSSLMHDVTTEQRVLLSEVRSLVGAAAGGRPAARICGPDSGAQAAQLLLEGGGGGDGSGPCGGIDALCRAGRRTALLHTVVDNLVLSLLTPWQYMQLCVAAFPCFPDLKMMLSTLAAEDGATPPV